MHAAAKDARNGNMDIKRHVRHIGYAFSNSGAPRVLWIWENAIFFHGARAHWLLF